MTGIPFVALCGTYDLRGFFQDAFAAHGGPYRFLMPDEVDDPAAMRAGERVSDLCCQRQEPIEGKTLSRQELVERLARNELHGQEMGFFGFFD